MSKQKKRFEAIRKFIDANYAEITSQPFDKSGYKKTKEAYFRTVMSYQYGIPKDEEICDILISLVIKREHIDSIENLRLKIDNIPFIQSINPNISKYEATINQVLRDVTLASKVSLLSDSEKIETLKRIHIDEKSGEIEEQINLRLSGLEAAIRLKEEEYKRLPSLLDDRDYEEPSDIPTIDYSKEWWEELNLKSNPFPGPLEGFHMIDKSLYNAIAVETEPIRWMMSKLNTNTLDFFHKGYLVSGEFGTGKTTFFDYISPHLALHHVEPIILPISENISVAHHVQSFQKQLSFKVCQLARKHGIPTTERIVDFIESELLMLDLQSKYDVKGFLLFIDDLHKHDQPDLVFAFLANLQMIKSSLSREGINVAFFVSGLPNWRDRIRQDSALTGFFDASEVLQLPMVPPSIAAQAISRRLRAFSANPDKDIQIKEDFFEAIFSRTAVERGGINIGFRPYIQEAQAKLSAKQFDILAVDFTTLDETSLGLIRMQIEKSAKFKESINKLIYGGKIEKQSIRMRTLKILCEVYMRKGVSEDDALFIDNKFSFKRLEESGFIGRADRQGRLVWRVSKFLEDLNSKIISERGFSLEDYLVQIYSSVGNVPKKTVSLDAQCGYEQYIQEWSRSVDKNVNDGLIKALKMHSELIKPYVGPNARTIPDLSLYDVERIDECIWELMKCILRSESPALLDIYGESNRAGWQLRHRALEGPQHFLGLQKIRNISSDFRTDVARKITFANEAFAELWEEFRKVLNIAKNTNTKAFNLPPKFLTCIYEEHEKLFAFTREREEYFASFERVVQELEQCIRNYLHISCLLLLGPYHTRIAYYPPDIRKYISTTVTQSTSYEAYNEFENMNRGQYRALFTQIDKKSPFFRFIIQPIISSWDSHDLDVFFNLFGDMNIVASHLKKMSIEELKQDIPTFFRLSCRLLSTMSNRIFTTVTFDNTISAENNVTTIVFGFRHKNTDIVKPIFTNSVLTDIPKELHRYDMSKSITDGFLEKILQVSDNNLGESIMDCLSIDEVRVKYGMEYSEAVSCVAYLTALRKIRCIVQYGSSLYLRKIEKPLVAVPIRE